MSDPSAVSSSAGTAPKPQSAGDVRLVIDRLAGASPEDQANGVEWIRQRFGEAAAKEVEAAFARPKPKPSVVAAPTPFGRRLGAERTPASVSSPAPAPPTSTPSVSSPVAPWSDVRVPAGASPLEALTYVPGLVGDITEWIIRGARRPNRVMALGVASVVIGTLIGRRIEGPTESATHLFVINLAPTGYGKDWPLQCGVKLMEVAGAGDLLGPQEWASAPGLIQRLIRNPLMVCFMDELGDELALVNSANGNAYVTKIIGLMKKCYNAFGTIISAEKVDKESEKIVWPAPSIVGAATPETFFKSLRPRDLESGFANRLMVLPFEGHKRPSECDPPAHAGQPPAELIAGLKRLPRQASISDQLLDTLVGQSPTPKRDRIGWGPGASEVYFAFSRKMDALEDTNHQQYELGMRACENAVRLATIAAVGRNSPVVDREDIAWAVALADHSFTAAVGGVDRYMSEYFEFPKFCERVLETLAQHDGWRSHRNLERDFRGNKKFGFELEKVLDQLIVEGRITHKARAGERGPASSGYRLVDEGEGET